MQVPHVVVVMSTFNGAKYLERQLDSIFAQTGVDVDCFVRDDGSSDDTVALLRRYAEHQPRLAFIAGQNVGWKRSFLTALSQAPVADFYAFSDQDDIWKPEKIRVTIETIPENQRSGLSFAHCNKLKVDDDLKEWPRQQHKIPSPSSLQWATLNGYAQGCALVMTKQLRDLVVRSMPLDENWGHDYWVGLLGYLFGHVYYTPEPLLYHVIHGGHGGNVSDTGNLFTNQMQKLKRMFDKGHFPNPAAYLLRNYSDMLNDDQRAFYERIAGYRRSLAARRWLAFRSGLYPQSRIERAAFRVFVMLGLY
ncbi:glycosyltransferases involved in cell wall biogenesis [Bifidobacterium margollesii]|uniref:Glycosyltransferases involved in cell wall biogenesis n=1 Tax=Bifidobacterium margollesii TaxID=2020964 RepID=A0A2N5J8Y5_9BIFI|nr:glycosyltransferase [Bifidobacterium margollesii]PLS30669.1 glycosyltransferases involved in cell wall biogenesis [Bifidobacterium margollesii]